MLVINNIVKFNEDELKIIQEDVHLIYNKILNTAFKRLIISNKYKIIAYITLILGFITIITGIILVAYLHAKDGYRFYFPVVITGIIIIFLGTLLITIGQFFSKKIKKAFIEKNTKYLKMAVNASLEAVEIKAITNNFTIIPQKFLVFGGNLNHRVWTEKVIIGNANGKDFNCGTMLEKITHTRTVGKTTTTKTTYNRYLYFTCFIATQDVVTTIVPEKLGSRLMGSNRGDQLESTEFEKLFALDYSDPIKLRKLLVPKVMSKMIDLASQQSPLPKIYISENQVTMMFPYLNLSSAESSSANLINLIIDNNEEKLLENVISMLNFTLNIFMSAYAWVASLDLNTDLVLKQNKN